MAYSCSRMKTVLLRIIYFMFGFWFIICVMLVPLFNAYVLWSMLPISDNLLLYIFLSIILWFLFQGVWLRITILIGYPCKSWSLRSLSNKMTLSAILLWILSAGMGERYVSYLQHNLSILLDPLTPYIVYSLPWSFYPWLLIWHWVAA